MNTKIIDRCFQPVFGKPCWGFRYDRNLNLSMNFGNPSLYVREPFPTGAKSEVIRRLAARRGVRVRGDWWLWLFCCYWRLISDGKLLATGSASFRRIERAMAQLEGQKLLTVDVATQRQGPHASVSIWAARCTVAGSSRTPTTNSGCCTGRVGTS